MSSPERAKNSGQSALDDRAKDLARDLAVKLTSDEATLEPQSLQALMSVLCRAYSAAQEAGDSYSILGAQDTATGTDVMIVCSALLKAAGLQVFELGMWSSWTGR